MGCSVFVALLKTILVHGLRDHLRDVSWENIFKLSASAATSDFLRVGSGWNWCIYPSSKVSGQASLISIAFGYLCCCHSSQKSLFRLCQKDKSSESTIKFRQASNRCKRVFEAVKLAYANKTKEPVTSQKLGSRGFWRTANSVLNKGKSPIPPLFNAPEVLSSASDKAKLFAENFSKNSNLDDSGASLPVFPSRNNLELHVFATPKLVEQVIMSLDVSKASGPDWIPVVVLRNYQPRLSYILAELFNKCFPDCI